MSFNDIFKSSFLESVTEFSVTDTLIGMIFALVIGLFIFLIYKKTFSGIMYSTGFAMSLVGLSLVTTLVIMAVTSNVVLSLGMVGALSIVRFVHRVPNSIPDNKRPNKCRSFNILFQFMLKPVSMNWKPTGSLN